MVLQCCQQWESMATPANDGSWVIHFSEFEADLRAGELCRNGSKVKIQEQPFQILSMLLERRGQVVTREELQSRLWPSDTFVDFDHSLNTAVKRLRDALDDTAENPRFIETLPRHGYRFITQTLPEVRSQSAKPLSKRSSFLVAAAVLVFASFFSALRGGWLTGRRSSRAPEQPQVRTLAVLPLTNLSADPKQEYLADAMTEELITELSRVGSLKVVSRTSVMRYKGESKKPLPQIAKELNVDAVLEGSVLREGNRVRIAAHLVEDYPQTDAGDGRPDCDTEILHDLFGCTRSGELIKRHTQTREREEKSHVIQVVARLIVA